MNKIFKAVIVLSIGLLVSSCARINFTRHGTAVPNPEAFAEWHQIGIFRLVEFSDPVDMQQRCQQHQRSEWTTITTEQKFVQGLLQGLTYSFYSPWDVAYSCR